MNGADLQRIRITAPYHPLRGQEFPIVRELIRDGIPHFIIRLPTGRTQLIPAHWTAPPTPLLAAPPLLVTPRHLRALLTLVAYLRSPAPTEACHDAVQPARSLGHAPPVHPSAPAAAVD